MEQTPHFAAFVITAQAGMTYNYSMQKLLFWIIFIIFIIQVIAIWQLWYITYPWIDIPLHIAGGAWLALLFFYVFEERVPVLSRPAPLSARVFLAVGFAVFIGAGWEVFEYLVGFLGGHFPWGSGKGSLHFDSLKDIVNDSIGAFLAALWFISRQQKSPT